MYVIVNKSGIVTGGEQTHDMLTGDSLSNVENLRSWLRECQEEHTRCSDRNHAAQHVDIIVVDALTNCLVGAKSNCRYVALSYVWDNVKQLQTTVANHAAP
jgi:hypothetical protein